MQGGVEPPFLLAFVGAMLARAGIEPSGSLAARSYLTWGIKLGAPRQGCIVVLKRGKGWQGHVAFFDREETGFSSASAEINPTRFASPPIGRLSCSACAGRPKARAWRPLMLKALWLVRGGFLRGYRSQVIGVATGLGALIHALAEWAVGDRSFISLCRAIGANWPLIAGGFGLATLAAKIERTKDKTPGNRRRGAAPLTRRPELFQSS